MIYVEFVAILRAASRVGANSGLLFHEAKNFLTADNAIASEAARACIRLINSAGYLAFQLEPRAALALLCIVALARLRIFLNPLQSLSRPHLAVFVAILAPTDSFISLIAAIYGAPCAICTGGESWGEVPFLAWLASKISRNTEFPRFRP